MSFLSDDIIRNKNLSKGFLFPLWWKFRWLCYPLTILALLLALQLKGKFRCQLIPALLKVVCYHSPCRSGCRCRVCLFTMYVQWKFKWCCIFILCVNRNVGILLWSYVQNIWQDDQWVVYGSTHIGDVDLSGQPVGAVEEMYKLE